MQSRCLLIHLYTIRSAVEGKREVGKILAIFRKAWVRPRRTHDVPDDEPSEDRRPRHRYELPVAFGAQDEPIALVKSPRTRPHYAIR